MTLSCIHGFLADQCAACRNCPHGLPAARCGRCVSATAAAALRRRVATDTSHPPQEHRGFEILYVPEVSGWQFRSPDETLSPDSYRSAFLARKAIDAIAEGTASATTGAPSAKKTS